VQPGVGREYLKHAARRRVALKDAFNVFAKTSEHGLPSGKQYLIKALSRILAQMNGGVTEETQGLFFALFAHGNVRKTCVAVATD
jgi:hypothetical protein